MEDRLGGSIGPNLGSRPKSTIAQEFAAEMDSFLATTIDPLEQKVEEKKLGVGSAQQELLELEARLKATEQRLASVGHQQSSPARATAPHQPQPQQQTTSPPLQPSHVYNSAPMRAPPPVPGGNSPAPERYTSNSASAGNVSSRRPPVPPYSAPRPPVGSRENTQQLMSHIPGHLPIETPPSGSRTPAGDYVMVKNEGL